MIISQTHRRARMSALAAAALAGALVLSGCNGTTDPQPSPTTTAPTIVDTPTEEPTTTETATETEEPTSGSALPELPDEAKENTPEGAEAFIRYYFDVVNELYQAPETGVIPEIASDECLSCQGLEDHLAKLASDNQHTSGDVYRVESALREAGTVENVEMFNMVVERLDGQVLGADGTEASTISGGLYRGSVGTIWEGEKWELLGLDLQPQS